MFKTLGNAWKIADLRKKILYTIFMLLIYRVGVIIPVPGVNASYVAESVGSYTALEFLNMMLGKHVYFCIGHFSVFECVHCNESVDHCNSCFGTTFQRW